jgi:hypothetical protein
MALRYTFPEQMRAIRFLIASSPALPGASVTILTKRRFAWEIHYFYPADSQFD